MAKNNHYKDAVPQKKSKPRHTLFLIAGVTAAVILCCAAIIAVILLRHNSTSTTPLIPPDSSIFCSISYPSVQSNGEIWSTGGMYQTKATDLRQALETDFAGKFTIEFAEDGTIAAIGRLRADDSKKFLIYKITNRGPTELSAIPAQITLEESISYEIVYADENGEHITQID